jgi:hypothetical protein
MKIFNQNTETSVPNTDDIQNEINGIKSKLNELYLIQISSRIYIDAVRFHAYLLATVPLSPEIEQCIVKNKNRQTLQLFLDYERKFYKTNSQLFTHSPSSADINDLLVFI